MKLGAQPVEPRRLAQDMNVCDMKVHSYTGQLSVQWCATHRDQMPLWIESLPTACHRVSLPGWTRPGPAACLVMGAQGFKPLKKNGEVM